MLQPFIFNWLIGTWSMIDSLNLTRAVEIFDSGNPTNVMANKTFVVTLIENPPYTMLKEDVSFKIQGEPNQNLKFVLAITPKVCISDPMLIKPKCV